MSSSRAVTIAGNPRTRAIGRDQSTETHQRALLAKIGICLTYLWRHRRFPNLREPRLFTELVQYRKLWGRDARMPIMADKVLVKAIVAQKLGSNWITPTYWSGTELPTAAPWPLPFVVKSRHGCNQIAFVRNGDENWCEISKRARRWLNTTYGVLLSEWLYQYIQKGVLVEPFVGNGDALPIDYKFYVFGEKVEYVQVHIEREHAHRWMLFDRIWRRVSALTCNPDPPQPANLQVMIEAAECLGEDFDFVRVDLYEIDGAPRFGEMTFYPGSGLDPFDPVNIDTEMGAYWLRARKKQGSL
jgi:hypothetical protein